MILVIIEFMIIIMHAFRHIQHSTIRLPDVRKAREVIQRVNPCLEEFLVVLCIMFWSLGENTSMICENMAVLKKLLFMKAIDI